MVLVQKWPFFQVLFLGNIAQEKVSYDILEQKISLSRQSKQEVQKVEKLTFSKGVNPWFWSKNGHFSIFFLFFLGNIVQENVCYDIVERRNAFLSDKNEKLKKSKNWRFCKGVNPWFWSEKIDIFPTFFFRQNRPRKCLSPTKQCLSRLKIQEVNKVEKLTFSQRG